ncbi:MAG: hypothetical protein J5738_06595 [Lachnospiraceae bacterium]|nr:hypothetical protein [Lachnospiraceae bacterium]
MVKSLKVGECFKFGSYELDGDPSNGNESIQWIVLKKVGMTVQLCSKDILVYQSFNESERDITWKTCSLRTWLNNEFYSKAFSPNEQKKIMSTDVKAEDNSKYGTKGGDTTKDKVYLLSEDELYDLVDSGVVDASCPHTENNKLFRAQSGFWLRSPGKTQSLAAVYQGDWTVNPSVSPIEEQGVRPVIWIDLSK